MLQHLRNLPDHIITSRLLPHLPINLCRILQLLRIGHQMRRQNTRADGSKRVEGFRVAELPAGDVGGELEVAGADIVADCVA